MWLTLEICVISNEDLSLDVGPSIVVKQLIQEWTHANIVKMITANHNNLDLNGVESIRVGPPPMDFYSRNLARAFRAMRNSDVVFNTRFIFPFSFLGRFLARRQIFTLMHDNFYMEELVKGSNFRGRFLRHLNQSLSVPVSNYLVTGSHASKARIVESYGNRAKVHVIEYGVDTDLFKKLGQPKEDYILFVGYTDSEFKRKGIVTLLQSYHSLVKSHVDLRLCFVGRTSDAIVQAVSSAGVSSKVDILGYRDRTSLVELYNKAVMLVLPSVMDGYGLVVNEAMACGTPVVVSDEVGASEVVRKAGCGLVFKANDFVGLASCMRTIAENTELAGLMGDRGAAYAREFLSWKDVSQRFLGFFKQSVSSDR